MEYTRSVLLVLILLAGSLSPPVLHAQEADTASIPEQRQGFFLEQNYPNPVNPETWIPFQLEESLFRNSDSVVVTIRIFNILSQVVAIPQSVEHPDGPARILNLVYREPGRKIAYWDGNDTGGRRVPTAVYYVQMVVEGDPRTSTRKITALNPRRRNIFPWFSQ